MDLPGNVSSPSPTLSESSSASRPLLGPITRLLPARSRLQAVSMPTLAMRGNSQSPEVRLRPHASLPIRKPRVPNSDSSPVGHTRRHRMARRFPKRNEDGPDDVPLDVLEDFFDTFALPSFCSVQRQSFNTVNSVMSASMNTPSATESAPALTSVSSAPPRNEAASSDSAIYSPSPVTPASSCSHALACTDRCDRVRGEIAMFRRFVQAELRETREVEDSRYATLAESVQEAVRLVTALEGRIDAMRIPQRVATPPRPSTVLGTMILDAVASVILFFISFFIARPFAFIRRMIFRPQLQPQQTEPAPRVSRSWRLSGRDFDDPFLGTVAKRISYSAATALAE